MGLCIIHKYKPVDTIIKEYYEDSILVKENYKVYICEKCGNTKKKLENIEKKERRGI